MQNFKKKTEICQFFYIRYEEESLVLASSAPGLNMCRQESMDIRISCLSKDVLDIDGVSGPARSFSQG